MRTETWMMTSVKHPWSLGLTCGVPPHQTHRFISSRALQVGVGPVHNGPTSTDRLAVIQGTTWRWISWLRYAEHSKTGLCNHRGWMTPDAFSWVWLKQTGIRIIRVIFSYASEEDYKLLWAQKVSLLLLLLPDPHCSRVVPDIWPIKPLAIIGTRG